MTTLHELLTTYAKSHSWKHVYGDTPDGDWPKLLRAIVDRLEPEHAEQNVISNEVIQAIAKAEWNKLRGSVRCWDHLSGGEQDAIVACCKATLVSTTESGCKIPWCPHCGPFPKFDEDGCCTVCGADTGEVPTVASQATVDEVLSKLEQPQEPQAIKPFVRTLIAERDAAIKERDGSIDALEHTRASLVTEREWHGAACKERDDAKSDLAHLSSEFDDLCRKLAAATKELDEVRANRDALRKLIDQLREVIDFPAGR